ncbi:MAG TPA: cytochrome c oxidase assembly protein [Caulobacteraceae bacterium]
MIAPLRAGGSVYGYAPYCGAPPDPADLLWRWNLDPVLIVALCAIAASYALLTRSRGPAWVAPWRRLCFYGGWSLGAAALISPLCALSVSLFSARVSQHMVLEMIVAPLIALGRPSVFLAWLGRLGGKPPITPRSHGALAASGVFAAALWFWHAPGPYTATFASDGVYWLMHVTAFGTALWLWTALFAAARERLGDFLAAATVTTLQMGFLGAVLTFAADPIYRVHWLTTAAWGMTPLQDQQLGGVIMWIPAGAVILGAITTAMALAMRRAGARPPTPASARA